MRVESLYVVGTGRRLPPVMTLEEAERAGHCERRQVWRTEVRSVCVSEDESGPEMAAHAARTAVRQAGAAPAEIDLILHADTWYQGHDMWAPASFVQREAVGNSCPAIEVRQMSNGGLCALDLAVGYLLADPERTSALVTTGDRFCAPAFDRWRSDPGTVFGDAGTAVVVSRRPGFARLRSIVTVADAGLEQMQRGVDGFGPAPASVRATVDVETLRQDFVRASGLDGILDRIDRGQSEAIERALADAGTKLDDVDWFVLPNLGRGRLNAHFFQKFAIDPDRTTWSWGRQVGHLGAGDQIAGLGQLADSGVLQPGQRVLLAGVGAGFTWSCAVVEMLRRPPTTARPTRPTALPRPVRRG
ncbi:ketoacyl-ACP synthase III family protein [Micromonospora sp. WMMD882]|uniref:ketoacyl-ACP synthase III family protein n=1 Tax=Micromonospora sp. WMMD882 TaxID=3015151 RepID=UPI00248D2A92|nr:ketoacyl-ACP synthase III family protein [Micromonospora sp. WMMD882]WBB81517.1 ketoacyl-ACP synthase III family protein [Micromonospora sp. WMMD882]